MNVKGFFSTFKGKLTLLLIAAILLPLITVGAILGKILQNHVSASFARELEAGLEIITLVIEGMENDLVEMADNIADDSAVEEGVLRNTISDLKKTVTSQRKVLDVSLLAVFDTTGQRLASDKFKSKNLKVDLTLDKKLQVVKSEEEDEFYLLYVTPIRKKGKVLGKLVGGVLLNDKKDFISFLRARHLENAVFWLDGEMVLTDLESNKPVVKPQYQPGAMIDFRVAGKSYKGVMRARMLGDTRLEYALLIPLSRLREALFELALAVIAIVIVLFLVFLSASSVIIDRVVRPLHRLTDHARRLSANHFTPQADSVLPELATDSRNEVGKLADSFLHMEQQLQTYIHDLTESTRANEKIQSELRIAREIQMNMLPRRIPALTNGQLFEVAAAIEPAEEVGGDFYDYFMIDEQHLCVIIGDVSEKGVPASLFMAMSKTLLRAVTTMTRTLARTGILPNEVLDRVNLELCRDKDKNKDDRLMFVTIFYGVLNTKNGELNYSSAGHNPPFRLSPSSGVAALQILQGGPLGIKQGRQYQSGILNLHHGEGLLLYTDGITEARNDAGSRYTEARLAEFLGQTQSHATTAIATEVIREIKRFAGSKPPDDDMTVLALKYL